MFAFILLIKLDGKRKQSELDSFNLNLEHEHKDILSVLQSNIKIYTGFVAALRSFTINNSAFPNENEMKNFLLEIVNELPFKDSLIVSFIDTSQVFKYSVTPYKIDPSNLKGKNVKNIRSTKEIAKLKTLIEKGKHITLFKPINLIEGYPAFPFNFPAIDKNGKRLGYIAPLIRLHYFLSAILDKKSEFYHRFSIDGIVFTRFAVYDKSKIYHSKKDTDFVNNFDEKEYKIKTSILPFHGLPLKVETRYKSKPVESTSLNYLIYAWCILFLVFVIISFLQAKHNQKIVEKLAFAHRELRNINRQQEKNLNKIKNLIREIHHRVKNNLQIISSLLNLQSQEEISIEVKNALLSTKSRVQSMALVHNKLYGNENFDAINANEYITSLCENISQMYESKKDAVKTEILIDKTLTLSIDTVIPLGLMLNELLTNTFKYAFGEQKKGQIGIQLTKNEDDYYALIYKDSGLGFDFEQKSKNSFGLELILMLTEQLKGKIEYNRTQGPNFVIKFKEVF